MGIVACLRTAARTWRGEEAKEVQHAALCSASAEWGWLRTHLMEWVPSELLLRGIGGEDPAGPHGDAQFDNVQGKGDFSTRVWQTAAGLLGNHCRATQLSALWEAGCSDCAEVTHSASWRWPNHRQ